MSRISDALATVKNTLAQVRMYTHASALLEFDQQTLCPNGGKEEQGEVNAFLSNQAFILQKNSAYVEACQYLYDHRSELTAKICGSERDAEFDVSMVDRLHRDFAREKNITPEMQHEHSLVYNRAYVNWFNAKQSKDFSVFAPSLSEVREVQIQCANLNENRKETVYDTLLDGYERGLSSKDLDDAFEECKARLIPLLKRIMASKKKIRTDFLSRTVSDESQEACARYLLGTIGFDSNRGSFATTEHPFTIEIGKDDTRVTTHYYPEAFYSSMYSIIHEGGHALFEQNQPVENYSHFIDSNKTMGMHESVSRFYENRIGRSPEFISLIYPKCCELFPNVFEGVSEREFYESMNTVTPSLIRTEADEFTYTFHIIIRYEIERMLVNEKNVDIAALPKLWNDKYMEYLGVKPSNDAEGILQDIHWASGFGYFPTYALGNMYNAMYYNKMSSEFDLHKAIRSGDFATVNGWMKEHVWARADREEPRTWIKNITGREFTPKDFLDYLENKYSEIYDL